MNPSNHTPAPWHTQGCTIYAAGNRIAQTWDTCDDFPTPEMEADARLIASAPDLLRALERLVHPMADDEDLDHARAIIARAKGGTK